MSGASPFSAALPFLSEESSLALAASHFLTVGGREAIAVDPDKGMNGYFVSTTPASDIDYASAFANSISPAAFASAQRLLGQYSPGFEMGGAEYATQLEKLRLRLRDAYGLPHSVDIVFASSAADAEYAALALGCRDGSVGIDNIVLGMEETDVGCDLAMAGQHVSALTPVGATAAIGAPVDAALAAQVRLIALPIRDSAGDPIPPDDVVLTLATTIETSLREGRHPIVRVVHGSLTGLVTPSLHHVDALRRRYGHKISLVVDAAQGRIGRDFVAAYLSRGASIMISGSKFLGGPPTSAFVFVPASARSGLNPLPTGYATLFSRHEWPATWPGVKELPNTSNIGQLVRLTAAIFELELFVALAPVEVRRVVHQFNLAANRLIREVGFARVSLEQSKYTVEDQARPVELLTSVFMDTSRKKMADDVIAARSLHVQLISAKIRGSSPVRLGPPVKCIKLPDGRFAGNLSLSLSMPQIVDLAGLETSAIAERFDRDFQKISKRIYELT